MFEVDDKAIDAAYAKFRKIPISKPLRDALRAAISAYEAALWQPVTKDEPKQGTRVYAIQDTPGDYERCSTIAWRDMRGMWWSNEFFGIWPTRFRPLPGSPKDSPNV